jgi:hypothetical protein
LSSIIIILIQNYVDKKVTNLYVDIDEKGPLEPLRGGILTLKTSERSKRNIPLPIFKNEPVGRNNEYTYNSAMGG